MTFGQKNGQTFGTDEEPAYFWLASTGSNYPIEVQYTASLTIGGNVYQEQGTTIIPTAGIWFSAIDLPPSMGDAQVDSVTVQLNDPVAGAGYTLTGATTASYTTSYHEYDENDVRWRPNMVVHAGDSAPFTANFCTPAPADAWVYIPRPADAYPPPYSGTPASGTDFTIPQVPGGEFDFGEYIDVPEGTTSYQISIPTFYDPAATGVRGSKSKPWPRG